MVEIHRPRECRECARRQRGVEHAVGNAAVEEHAQRPLEHIARALARDDASGVFAAFQLMVGKRLRGEKARLERRMDAAGGQRRHEARRIADQRDAAARRRRHRPAHRNEPAAAADAARTAEIEKARQLAFEGAELRTVRLPAREADL